MRGIVFGGLCGVLTAVMLWIARRYSETHDLDGYMWQFTFLWLIIGGYANGMLPGALVTLAAASASRRTARPIQQLLVGAGVGMLLGALSVGVLNGVRWTTGWPEPIEGVSDLARFLHLPLGFQLLIGLTPASLCGLLGASQVTTTRTICHTCRGDVRPDGSICAHCGVPLVPTLTAISWSARLWWWPALAGLSLVVYFGIAGTARWMGAQTYRALPEVDHFTLPIAQAVGSHTEAELSTILGEPPLAYRGDDNVAEEWVYPIRVTPDSEQRPILAPVLEIALDPADRVAGWGFYHPVTHDRLPIRETVMQEHQWLDVCEASYPRERIELAAFLRPGITTKREVLQLARVRSDAWTDDAELERRYVHATPGGNSKVVTLYVDHPSPLLNRPNQYYRWFSSDPLRDRSVRISYMGSILHFCP